MKTDVLALLGRGMLFSAPFRNSISRACRGPMAKKRVFFRKRCAWALAKQPFFNLREKFVEPLFCTIHFGFVKLYLSL